MSSEITCLESYELVGKGLLFAVIPVYWVSVNTNLSMLSTSLQPQKCDDWKRSLYEHTGMSLHIMHAIVL